MENQRVRVTKTMLRDALFELLETKPIDRISVHELCATAQINRTTFYKYYGSPHDLLDEVKNSFFIALETQLHENCPADFDNLKEVLLFLDRERKKCRILINSIPDQEFSELLFRLPAIRELIKSCATPELPENLESYVRLFFCQGGYAIIRKWLNDDPHESPEEIARLLLSLTPWPLA